MVDEPCGLRIEASLAFPVPPFTHASMNFAIETEQESDGRWLAEIAPIPGVLAYGATRQEAVSKAETLALRVLADRECNFKPEA
jgi:predicted RNase H-like HicB family nuclease